MAQHDYVIANGTGAAVRSDLNNGLAAIVSNNSGASEPATMYAYQWWADTTTGLLKLRNSANNAWITLRQLDGEFTTLPVENGTAAAPSIYFKDSGTDTGIYSPGTDQVAISTNGTQRFSIGSTGAATFSANIATNGSSLDINPASGQPNITLRSGNTFRGYIEGNSSGGLAFGSGPSASIAMTIDSSQRVGIGTTSPSAPLHVYGGPSSNTLPSNFQGIFEYPTNGGIGISTGAAYVAGVYFPYSTDPYYAGVARDTTSLTFRSGGGEKSRIDSSGRLLVGTSSSASTSPIVVQGYVGVSAGAGEISITRGGTPSTADQGLGTIRFQNNNGNTGAQIDAVSEGSWTAGSNHRSRLTFSTTADGASSPTERMRITNAGFLKVSNTGTYNDVSAAGTYSEVMSNITSLPALTIASRTTSFISDVFSQGCFRSASTAFSCAKFFSGDGGTNAYSDTEFNFRGDGNAFADGSWTGGGADYAEYFEWSDSNPDAEDRRGISVVLNGDKIREAVAGEDPIGVISGNPSVVGDAAWNKWSSKHLRDEFGTYIQEDYEVEDEDGNTVVQQRRKLNPAYDPEVEYISREQRPEWDCVGLMGKLRIRKGQVTGSRWIKMRDISDSIEEWLVR